MAEYDFPKGRVIGGGAGGPAILRAGGLLIILFLVVIFLFASMAQVDAGNVAVLTLFGKVQPDVLDAGIHFVNPFSVKHQLTARTQELKESASVPSSEGLVIALDASLLFHLDRNKAPEVYQKLGENYLQNIVEPTLRSAVRE